MKTITKIYAFIVVSSFAVISCQRDAEFSSSGGYATKARIIIDQEFPAADIASQETTISPAFGKVEESLLMRERDPIISRIVQRQRKTYQQLARQGHDGSFAEEEFQISSAAKLDVLVVVDNSGSMDALQRNLATKLRAFTDGLSNVDWQIGIITSDAETSSSSPLLDKGCRLYGVDGKPGGRPIQKSDPDAANKFRQTLNAIGATGSRNEQLLRNTLRALNGTCKNGDSSWLRADAALGIIFLTDEDSYCFGDSQDRSDSTTCRTGEKPEDLLEFLRPRSQRSHVKAYSLTWRPNDSECVKDSDQHVASRILRVVNDPAISGKDQSICQADYTSSLQDFSKDVAGIIRREFTLQNLPLKDSVVVEVDGIPYGDYEIEGKVIKLKRLGDERVKVKVTYRHDAVPKFDRIKLLDKPDLSTFLISMDGAEIPSDQYKVFPEVPEVFFHIPPKDDASLVLMYREDAVLPDSFDVAAFGLAERLLGVKVDGKETVDFVLEDQGKQLKFLSPVLDGSVIELTHKPIDYLVRDYQLSYPKGDVEDERIVVKDVETGELIEASFEDKEVVFKDADIIVGRKVLVSYNYGDSETVLTHTLIGEPLDGTLQVIAKSDDREENCASNVILEGVKVSYSCHAETLAQVTFKYDYVARRYSQFTVNGDVPNESFIQVLIDDKPSQDYKRIGSRFAIPEDKLGAKSKVRIIITILEPVK